MRLHRWQYRKKGLSFADQNKSWKVVLKRLKYGDNVLDIGCGDCSFFDYIKGYKKANFYAYDIIEESRKIAEKKGYNALKALDVKEKFRIITLFEVIEHLEVDDKIKLAQQVSKLLTDDGYVFVSFPHSRSILAMQHYFDNIEHKAPIMNDYNFKIIFNDYRIVSKVYLNPWINPLKVIHSFITGYGFDAIYNNVLYVLQKKR